MTAPAMDMKAPAARGWLAANKWLLARRASQLAILALFLAGPLAGVWVVKGTLTSSLTLGVLPLTDPYVAVQSLLAGHAPAATALIGAAIVTAFYLLVGGRVYCSWVCPVNPITDAAGWLRRRLGIKGGRGPSSSFRHWLLGGTLLAALATGSIAWELVNPVSLVHRGLVYGMTVTWFVAAAIFLFDLFVAPRGWCGKVCPVGAFYGLLGRTAVPRVSAVRRSRCDDCMDCYAVCPEPQVINPALKGSGSPLILGAQCTNCGRCIDVCSKDVFRFTTRFDNAREDA